MDNQVQNNNLSPFLIIHVEPFKKSNPFCSCSSNHLVIQKIWQKSNVLTIKTECCTYSSNYPSHPLIHSFIKTKCTTSLSKGTSLNPIVTNSNNFMFINNNDDLSYSINLRDNENTYFYKLKELSEWCFRFYEVSDQLTYLLVIFDTQYLNDINGMNNINTDYFKLRSIRTTTPYYLGYGLTNGYSYDYLTSSIIPGFPTQLSTYDHLCQHKYNHIKVINHMNINHMNKVVTELNNVVHLIVTYGLFIDKWINYLLTTHDKIKIHVNYSFNQFKLVSSSSQNDHLITFIITTYDNLCNTDFYMKNIFKRCNSTLFPSSVLNSSDFSNSIWSMTHLFKLCNGSWTNDNDCGETTNNLFHLNGRTKNNHYTPYTYLIYDTPTLFITKSLNECTNNNNNMAKTIQKLKWINMIKRDYTLIIDGDKNYNDHDNSPLTNHNYRYPLSILTKEYWCIDKNTISLNNRRIQLFPFKSSLVTNDSNIDKQKKWYRIDPQIIHALTSLRPDLIHHFNLPQHTHNEIIQIQNVDIVILSYNDIEKKEIKFYQNDENENNNTTPLNHSYPLFFHQKSIFRQPPEPFDKVKCSLLDHWKANIEDKMNDKEYIFQEMEKTKLTLLTCLSTQIIPSNTINNNNENEEDLLQLLISKGKENEDLINQEIEGYAKQIKKIDHEINKMKRIIQYIDNLRIINNSCLTCAICFEHIKDTFENKYLGSAILFRCGHIVCRPCGLIICMDNQVPARSCPICRVGLSNELVLDIPPENFDLICAYPVYFEEIKNCSQISTNHMNNLLNYTRQIYGPLLEKIINIIYKQQKHNYIILVDRTNNYHFKNEFSDLVKYFCQLISCDKPHKSFKSNSKRDSKKRKISTPQSKNSNSESPIFDFIKVVQSCIYPNMTTTVFLNKNNQENDNNNNNLNTSSITFIQLDTLYVNHYINNGLIEFGTQWGNENMKMPYTMISIYDNVNKNRNMLKTIIERTSWLNESKGECYENRFIEIKNE